MRTRNIVLALLAALVVAGGAWYASLDKETRGLLAALPTDRDVLSWKQDQREAAFRAIDRAQKIEFQAKSYLVTTELFAWAAWPGLGLLVLGAAAARPPFRREVAA